MFRFGIPYVPSGLALIVMDQIGRFFLDRIKGKEATGLFSASYKLGMFMALIVAAFRFAWQPFFLKRSQQPDAEKVFSRVLTYFLLFTGFVFLVISYFVEDIVAFRFHGIGVFGGGYEEGLSIVPVILLAYIAYGIYVNLIIGVYVKKKTAYLPIVTGAGALSGIMANLVLVPRWSINGAAWATFIAYAVMAGSLYLFSRVWYPVPYEKSRLLKISATVCLLFFAGTYADGIARVPVRLASLILFLPVLYAIRFFTDEERRFLRKIPDRILRSGRAIR
jgi:O-antigen/teichoic acid export membrane protein